MTNNVEVDGGEFYHLKINDSEIVFETQANAIDHLRNNAGEINTDDPDIQLARVETGDEWTIEGVAWQNIALQLL